MVDLAESLLPRICPGGIKTLGRIAAGIPLEALTDDQQDDLLTLLTRPGRYALRVRGDALIEAGIFDGDTLVVQSQQHAQNGDIVVALIDNEQVTINRIRFTRPGQVQLLSDNDNTENLSLDKSRVAIQGKVVAQIRLYP